ncbi:MAG: hypothetical protein M3P53_12980 [Actinomycetota bacterium]|nr:hypothetical protein [Actinomycetota bacterium]
MNVVVIRGRLCRPPESRTLPSGDCLVSYQVTVPRAGDRAETVPVTWPAGPASGCDLDVDRRGRRHRSGPPSVLSCRGRHPERTEVVADRVVPGRHRARAADAVAAALARAGEEAEAWS